MPAFVMMRRMTDSMQSAQPKMGSLGQYLGLVSLLILYMLVALAPPGSTEYLALAQQVRTLTAPEQMGDLFKVMALAKSLDLSGDELLGFGLRDQRGRL